MGARGDLVVMENSLVTLLRIEFRFLGRPARRLVAILTELSRLIKLLGHGFI
jgi:hypothetical protein